MRTLYCLFLLFCLFVAPSYSQDSTQEQRANNPDFENLEFEITGKEFITLPPSMKHTVSDGIVFDASKVFHQYPLRGGTILPLQFTRQDSFAKVESGFPFYSSLRMGRFGTSQIKISGGKKLERGTTVFVRGEFESSNGNRYTETQKTDEWRANLFLETSVAFPEDRSWLSKGIGNAQIEISPRQYRLFGTGVPNAERKYTNISLKTTLKPHQFFNADHTFGFSYSAFSLYDKQSKTRSEHRLIFSAQGERTLNGIPLRFYSSFAPVFVDTFSNPLLFNAGGETDISLSQYSRLSAGLNGNIFRNGNGVLQGFFFPRFEWKFFSENYWSINAGVLPSVETHALSSLVSKNLFLSRATPIAYSRNVETFIEGIFQVKPDWKIHSRWSYHHQRNAPAFYDTANAGIWNVSYVGTTTISEWQTEGTYSLNTVQDISGKIILRSVQHTFFRNSNELAYILPAELKLTYRYRFSNALSTETRTTFFKRIRPYGDIVLVDAAVFYALNEHIDGSVIFNNLFDRKYETWKNYRGERALFSVGIIGRW